MYARNTGHTDFSNLPVRFPGAGIRNVSMAWPTLRESRSTFYLACLSDVFLVTPKCVERAPYAQPREEYPKHCAEHRMELGRDGKDEDKPRLRNSSLKTPMPTL
jgi:hypothetical protein